MACLHCKYSVGHARGCKVGWKWRRRYDQRKESVMAKTTKSMRRIVRVLQELRGCTYTAALQELRKLPEGTNWKDYIMRVAVEGKSDGK